MKNKGFELIPDDGIEHIKKQNEINAVTNSIIENIKEAKKGSSFNILPDAEVERLKRLQDDPVGDGIIEDIKKLQHEKAIDDKFREIQETLGKTKKKGFKLFD